jgi:integrase/recombinase XerD
MNNPLSFPELLQAFFTQRLMHQRQASPHTIASYRDTFRLLLAYAQRELGKQPTQLEIADLNASFIGSFLNHLEQERGNTPRTRNVRLAAIHAFFRFVSFREPSCTALAQQVMALPMKRFKRKEIQFLTHAEMEELLAAPDTTTWLGRRDRALLLVALQTGLRVAELANLRRQDVVLETGPHIRCFGKGRKERCTPLRKESADVLRAWLKEHDCPPSGFLFPGVRGARLSTDAIQDRLKKHLETARRNCSSLRKKRISPHALRHTTAMELLQAGVDCSIIAMWLGHESIETTRMYLHADITIKEKAIARTAPLNTSAARYHPDDAVLAFLKGL